MPVVVEADVALSVSLNQRVVVSFYYCNLKRSSINLLTLPSKDAGLILAEPGLDCTQNILLMQMKRRLV